MVKDFSASRGWIENFLKRNGFSLWRRTTVSKRLPQDLIPKVSSFVVRVRKLRLQHQYALYAIGETPLWLIFLGTLQWLELVNVLCQFEQLDMTRAVSH